MTRALYQLYLDSRSMIGQTISHYKILEKIGEGGMGVVYKAEDVNLRRTVALKFLTEKALGNEMEKTRFVREAQAEASLDHPNICAIHEIEEAEGQTFISMVYVEGSSLSDRIGSGSMGIDEALDIAVQIAGGLQEAHEKGIVHRDIKPANIMLTTKGQAKIMDFGLARLADAARMTKVGTVAGTLAYMSPEQVRGKDVDHRTDIWSLGVVLYELLTGQLPFSGDYEAAILYSIVNEEYISTAKINTSLPPEFEGVIVKALQKQVEDRYSSMQEMLDDLKQIQWRMSSSSQSQIEAAEKKAQWMPVRGTTVILAAILLAVIVFFAIVRIPYFRDRMTHLSPVHIAPVWVAFMDFEDHTGDPDIGYIVSRLLSADIEQCRYVNVFKAGLIQKRQEKQSALSASISTVFDFCGDNHIPYLVSGSIEQKGDSFTIVTAVYDVEPRNQRYEKRFSCIGKAAIYGMIDEVSKEIKDQLVPIPVRKDEVDLPVAQLTSSNLDALIYYYRGMDDYNDSDPFRGVRRVQKAAELDSTFVMALRFLAIWYNYSKDSQEASMYAERAVTHSLEMGTVQKELSYFIENMVNKDWGKADHNLDVILLQDPDNPAWYREKGYIHSHHIRDFEKAISNFEKAIELDTLNLSGRLGRNYNHLAHVYLYTGQLDKGMKAFEMYRNKSGPTNPDAVHSMGFAYQFTGKYKQAIEQYKNTLLENEGFYVAYEDLGKTYLAIGKWREAISTFDKYLWAVKESGPNGYILRGSVYFVQENLLEARREVSRALEEDPRSIQAHWLNGLIALELAGDVKTAREELIELQKLTEDSGSSCETAYYHHLQGLVLLHENRFDAGLESLRSAEKISIQDFAYFGKELVRGYLQAGLFKDAISKAKTILTTFNENNAELQYLLGLAYEAEGKRDKQMECFQKADQIWKEADGDFRPLERLISKLGNAL